MLHSTCFCCSFKCRCAKQQPLDSRVGLLRWYLGESSIDVVCKITASHLNSQYFPTYSDPVLRLPSLRFVWRRQPQSADNQMVIRWQLCASSYTYIHYSSPQIIWYDKEVDQWPLGHIITWPRPSVLVDIIVMKKCIPCLVYTPVLESEFPFQLKPQEYHSLAAQANKWHAKTRENAQKIWAFPRVFECHARVLIVLFEQCCFYSIALFEWYWSRDNTTLEISPIGVNISYWMLLEKLVKTFQNSCCSSGWDVCIILIQKNNSYFVRFLLLSQETFNSWCPHLWRISLELCCFYSSTTRTTQ